MAGADELAVTAELAGVAGVVLCLLVVLRAAAWERLAAAEPAAAIDTDAISRRPSSDALKGLVGTRMRGAVRRLTV